MEDSIRNACRSWWDLTANHEKFDKYADEGMPQLFDEFDQKYYSKKYPKTLLIEEQKSMKLNTKGSFIQVIGFDSFESGVTLKK